jgi:hypothetical protein
MKEHKDKVNQRQRRVNDRKQLFFEARLGSLKLRGSKGRVDEDDRD